MSDLVPFQFDAHEIRVNTDDPGNILWNLADLCAAFGLSNPSEVVSRLESDEYNTLRISEGIPGNPGRLFVNEKGLYRLIFRSNKPEAKRFQNWVFGEVLPSIRKAGKYEIPTPDLLPEDLAIRKMKAWLEIGKMLGPPLYIVQQEAAKAIEQSTGINLRPLLLAAPAQDQIADEDVMLEPNDLAQRLGLSSGQVVNQLIALAGWQVRQNGVWEATTRGAPYCAQHAWTTDHGAKSGINYKWRLTAVKRLLQERNAHAN